MNHLRRANATRRSQVHPPQSRLDLWLVRSGYIAQVGVLVATILGFYFTVIPLYQKAALDELIAQRERDLRTAQIDIQKAKREAYEQYRQNFMQRFSVAAAERCSGSRASFSQPDLGKSPDQRHEDSIRIDINAAACLDAALLEQKAGEVLTGSDLAFLKALLVDTGKSLETKRIAALSDIAQLPEKSRLNPSVLRPLGEFSARAYDFEDRVAAALKRPISQEVAKSRLNLQVKQTQAAIAREYRQHCFSSILGALRRLSWPAWDQHQYRQELTQPIKSAP